MIIKQGTRIHNISDKASTFMGSKKAWISFGLTIAFISIVQLILFGTGIIEMNGVSVNNPDAYKYWISLSLSAIAAVAVQIGFIFTSRRDKRFYYFMIIAIISNIVISILFKLYFSLLRVSINVIIMTMQFVRWKHPKHREIKQMNNLLLAGIMVGWILGAWGVGNWMSQMGIQYAHPIMPYVDFFAFRLALTANLTIMLGYQEGQFVKIFSNIAVSVNMMLIGQWISIVTAFVSATNATLSWLKWSLEYTIQEKLHD